MGNPSGFNCSSSALISTTAPLTAREAVYPASIAADVNAERLKPFFTKEDDFFRVRKEIRDSVVFSVQDLIRDPPFRRGLSAAGPYE